MPQFDDDNLPVIDVDEGKIANRLHMELVKLGYVPSSDEILDIAAIVFDYLVELTEDAFDGES